MNSSSEGRLDELARPNRKLMVAAPAWALTVLMAAMLRTFGVPADVVLIGMVVSLPLLFVLFAVFLLRPSQASTSSTLGAVAFAGQPSAIGVEDYASAVAAAATLVRQQRARITGPLERRAYVKLERDEDASTSLASIFIDVYGVTVRTTRDTNWTLAVHAIAAEFLFVAANLFVVIEALLRRTRFFAGELAAFTAAFRATRARLAVNRSATIANADAEANAASATKALQVLLEKYRAKGFDAALSLREEGTVVIVIAPPDDRSEERVQEYLESRSAESQASAHDGVAPNS